jgi:hypothetical protein
LYLDHQLQKFDQIDCYHKALELNPNFSYAFYFLGNALKPGDPHVLNLNGYEEPIDKKTCYLRALTCPDATLEVKKEAKAELEKLSLLESESRPDDVNLTNAAPSTNESNQVGRGRDFKTPNDRPKRHIPDEFRKKYPNAAEAFFS